MKHHAYCSYYIINTFYTESVS